MMKYVGKQRLTWAVLFAISSMPFVAHANTSDIVEAGNLSPYQVYSKRVGENTIGGGYVYSNGEMGMLGHVEIMKSSFQQNNLTNKAVTTFSNDVSTSATSVLVNVPSVRTAGNTLYTDYSIRGQNASAYQYRINGVPGLLSQSNFPMNFVDQVQVISGPGLAYEGVAPAESAGGVVNFKTKRAGLESSIEFKTGFSGRGTWSNQIDLTKGNDTKTPWGVRFIAAHNNGETGIRHEKLRQTSIGLNIDHGTTHHDTNFFLGYRDTYTKRAERYYQFTNSAITEMPKAPHASNNYTYEGNALGMRTWLFTLNHTQKLTDTTKVFFNAGYAYNNGYEYLTDSAGRLDVINNNGDLRGTMSNEPFAIRNGYAQLGVSHTVHTGLVKHNLVLAYDKDWNQKRWGSPASAKAQVTGNLYTGNVTRSGWTHNAVSKGKPGRTRYTGFSAIDTMEYNKWTALWGVHYHKVANTNTSNVTSRSSATSPVFGLVYRPNQDWSLFANHSESFDQGSIVANRYANGGEILDPRKTKSNEVGVKYNKDDFYSSLSYFDMKQETLLENGSSTGSLRLSNDGSTRYKGLEFSVGGKVAPKWNVMGGFLFLHSKYETSMTSYLRGKGVMGTSKWSSVFMTEYQPNTQWDVWGRMVYTGKAPIYTSVGTELTVPGSVVFDVGARYRSMINNVPVTYEVGVYNLFNRNYWLPRASYAYGILGNPRTISASVTMKF